MKSFTAPILAILISGIWIVIPAFFPNSTNALEQETEIVKSTKKFLAYKCIRSGLDAGQKNDEVKKIAIACPALYYNSLKVLRNGTIQSPNISGLKPSDAAFKFVPALMKDRKNSAVLSFLIRSVGKDRANELVLQSLLTASMTFLQEDKGINMGL